MDYLVRFAQVHESFRRPELQALADLNSIAVEFLDYSHLPTVSSAYLMKPPPAPL